MAFPEQLELIRDLVINDHVALDDEPLLLAVYYASGAAPNEECLFEVARNFGYGGPDEDKHIFQIEFGPSPKFLLPEGRHLRLSLTNPDEFRLAVKEGWPEVRDLQEAIGRGQYKEVYRRDNDRQAEEARTLLGLPTEKTLVAA